MSGTDVERDEFNGFIDPLALLGEPGTSRRTVNWQYLCKHHVELQAAWRKARCRLRWITPPHNVVWRIKSDLESGVLLSTGRVAGIGLVAVDRLTSRSLFRILGVSEWSHLEAGRGFAVFNRPTLGDEDSCLEVWRNNVARSRSGLKPVGSSPLTETAESLHGDDPLNPYNPHDPDTPLPRGHMQYFRTLVPPTDYFAFRCHVDGADGDNPRAVVAAASSSAVFIWHLEEDKPMQTIDRSWGDFGRANYIELDDKYVFICLERQMHVYSRVTGRLIVSFPPIRSSGRDIAALAFPLVLADDFKAIPDGERLRHEAGGTTRDGVPAPAGRAVLVGSLRGEPGFDEAIYRALSMHPVRVSLDRGEDIEYYFTACHYTSNDLVCTAKTGAVFVVHDYHRVLAEAERIAEMDRALHVAINTFVIGVGDQVKQLTTYRDHIAIVTRYNVILLDATNFPDIPMGPVAAPVRGLMSARPHLLAHVLLGNNPHGVKMSRCVQMDYRSLYLAYWASGEAEATADSNADSASFPPHAAIDGFGMCVKVWTFGP